MPFLPTHPPGHLPLQYVQNFMNREKSTTNLTNFVQGTLPSLVRTVCQDRVEWETVNGYPADPFNASSRKDEGGLCAYQCSLGQFLSAPIFMNL